MPLTDQQLRQELVSFGETVPPITQRNREQLRTRLEALRGPTRSRAAAASPSRPIAPSSPIGTRATAASPSRGRAIPSPSRPRAAASPSRTLATASPTRTRANGTTSTSATRTSTRSKPTGKLIELSDSETDNSTAEAAKARVTSSIVPNVQTRSIASRRQPHSPTPLAKDNAGVATMTNDVEESIARHRREIKQLLDSARDRNRPVNPSASPSSAGQQQKGSTTPTRPRSPSSSSKSRSPEHSPKSARNDSKSSITRAAKSSQTCWKKFTNLIGKLLKILIVSSILLGGAGYLREKSKNFFPPQQEISCSVKNATKCEDMAPVINAVRKQLQIRTGEVDCKFRPASDLLVRRAEVERNLNEKGLKFKMGNAERWNALITYVFDKPVDGILVWNQAGQMTKSVSDAQQLSSPDAVRSLTCRARQNVDTKLRNIALLILGSSGLITLAWYLRLHGKKHEEKEENFQKYLFDVTDLLEEQYEKHIRDPHTQPWLAVSHIRDKLIPEADRQKLTHLWERVKAFIAEHSYRIRSDSQIVQGELMDVWHWIEDHATLPKRNRTESPKKSEDEDHASASSDVGLTECLKLRNFFDADNCANDEEIDRVVDGIQHRCANIKRIDHIGIHSTFVYLKFSSKEAAAQGYHLLNNWKYHGQVIHVKYIRLNRYYEHFPEARDSSSASH